MLAEQPLPKVGVLVPFEPGGMVVVIVPIVLAARIVSYCCTQNVPYLLEIDTLVTVLVTVPVRPMPEDAIDEEPVMFIESVMDIDIDVDIDVVVEMECE